MNQHKLLIITTRGKVIKPNVWLRWFDKAISSISYVYNATDPAAKIGHMLASK